MDNQECKHEFLRIYDTEELKEYPIIRCFCKCLSCNQEVFLDYEEIDLHRLNIRPEPGLRGYIYVRQEKDREYFELNQLVWAIGDKIRMDIIRYIKGNFGYKIVNSVGVYELDNFAPVRIGDVFEFDMENSFGLCREFEIVAYGKEMKKFVIKSKQKKYNNEKPKSHIVSLGFIIDQAHLKQTGDGDIVLPQNKKENKMSEEKCKKCTCSNCEVDEVELPKISFEYYSGKAWETALYPNAGIDMTYSTLGLCGEAGEVAEKVKKIIRDKKGVFSKEDKLAIAKELGDSLWYINAIAITLGFSLEEIARLNNIKLSLRKQHNLIHGSGDDREDYSERDIEPKDDDE